MGERQTAQPVPLKVRFRAFLIVSLMRIASALLYSARIRARPVFTDTSPTPPRCITWEYAERSLAGYGGDRLYQHS